MQILFRLLNTYRSIVDRVDLWCNCTDPDDSRLLRSTAALDPWYRLVRLPDQGVIDPNVLWHSVCKFYTFACDPDTIYIKCDDDMVWLDDLQHFIKFLDYRIDNADYFLVSANVMINAVCNYFHSQAGLLPANLAVTDCNAHDANVFYNGQFVKRLHEFVLEGPQERLGSRWQLHNSQEVTQGTRLCINFISWFGKDFQEFGGKVPQDDEEWLTVEKPKQIQKKIAICPDYTCVHYSFGPTRNYLDKTDILSRYRALCIKS